MMESLTPNIFTHNLNETISFYQGLGFTTAMTVPDSGEPFVWAMMVNGNVSLMFQTFESIGDDLTSIRRDHGGSLLLYIKLKNIRAFFEDISRKINVLKGLEKTFYGATEFSIEDNNGYVLTFAEDEPATAEQ